MTAPSRARARITINFINFVRKGASKMNEPAAAHSSSSYSSPSSLGEGDRSAEPSGGGAPPSAAARLPPPRDELGEDFRAALASSFASHAVTSAPLATNARTVASPDRARP
jgi:hypothetical protein